MRNLKRVLSLALASVMLLGMMVIGASAADKTYADLTDSDKITNQEAVSVLVDIGIIEGKTDGSYDPSATVDRATMAKLITMMLMGDVDQSAFKGTVTDLKDIDKSWAEGYIKYCYANGIIEGDGKGSFFPTEPVTVVQAAKMLLVAIGYNAENRGYSKDTNWSTNIMRDAQTTLFYNAGYTTTIRSLTKGLSVRATDPLTRDDAAQMIFNALFVQNYSPEYQYDGGVRYISKYAALPSLAATTYNGLTRNTGVLTGINENGYATVTGAAAGDGIKATDKISADVSLMGKVVSYYKAGTKLVSSAVVEDKDNTAVTVPGNLADTAAVTKWLANNGLALSGKAADNKIIDYVNTPNTQLAESDLVKIGNYTVAYVIDSNGDGVINSLVKTTKTVSEVTGAVKTKTTDGKVTVSVPGVTAGYVKAVGYEDLSRGDLVMHITYAGTTYITKAETVTGKITGYKGDTAIYIDGTSYTRSSGAYGGQTVKQMAALDDTAKKDVTLFLDENGNALYVKLVDTTSTYNVAVVLGYTTVGSSVEDSITATARLLFPDGTVDVVDVAGGNGTTIAPDATLTTGAQAAETNYYLVAYTVDGDGNYNLTKLTTSEATLGGKKIGYTAIDNASIEPGKAVFTTGFIGNANTAFVVANYNSNTKFSTTTTTTGIANAPKYDSSAKGVVITVDGIAAMVFVTSGSLVDTSATSNYVFIPNSVTPSYSSADKLYTYSKGYVNGEEMDVVSKVELTKNTVIKVSLNDKDQVIKQEDSHGGKEYTGVSYSNEVLTVNTAAGATEAYYTLADDAKVFEIDADGKVTEIAASGITADKTDKVIVLGASNMDKTMKAQYVYITKTESAVNKFTVQAYTVGSTGEKTNRGSSVEVETATGATAKTVATGVSVTIAAATDAKVGLTITAADGAIVSVPAEKALVGDTTSYEFVVTSTSESGAVQTCTVTVTFGGVSAS